MENYAEKAPVFRIELPTEGEELALATMHIQAWKETYVVPESGLTNEMVDEMKGSMLTNTDFRKKIIQEALSNPENVLYRVVKNENGDIVGFLHGSKQESHNELEAIYLLNEAKGSGTGSKLMEEFLAWSDKNKYSRLEAFGFNSSAIGFYEKYGFKKTDTEIEPYKGTLPVIEMVRPAEDEFASND
ncbi:MAG: GNAT family N-acetyltransferase [Candidatus Paceibacterota bacterium]